MGDRSDLVRGIEIQAAGCDTYGSPFSAGILRAVALDLAEGGPAKTLFQPWLDASARSVLGGAVPLRLLGGLHDLVLSGDTPGLAALYPRPASPGDAETAWPRAREAMIEHGARLADFMTHEPQTNEVRRTACLLPGFLTVARETGLPMRCFELGASAGLNQLWDRFGYRYGDAATWGDVAASVVVDAEWSGPPAPWDAAVSVSSRGACDRKPVDLADPLARRRLRAYVWPDQADRLSRVDAAIAEAMAAGIVVDAEDAVSWCRRRATPTFGAATVLYHSVFWQYMPVDSQATLTEVIGAHGAAASRTAPFAWLRMEPDPGNLAVMALRLTIWPSGEERRLATVHPHGARVDWH